MNSIADGTNFHSLASSFVSDLDGRFGCHKEFESASDPVVRSLIADSHRESRNFRVFESDMGWLIALHPEDAQSCAALLVSKDGHILHRTVADTHSILCQSFGEGYLALQEFSENIVSQKLREGMLCAENGTFLCQSVGKLLEAYGVKHADHFVGRGGKLEVIEGTLLDGKKVVVRIIVHPEHDHLEARAASVAIYQGGSRHPFWMPYSGLRPLTIIGPIFSWKELSLAISQFVD